jgi:transcriptional regulator with PAS, ATPase and Fis domain
LSVPQDQTPVFNRPKLVRYPKTRIAIVRGPDLGSKIDVAGTSVRLGTAPDNDLVLTDTSVSRRHCSIEPTKSGVHIRDEGSTNGIFIAGIRVFDAVIPGEVSLQLGETLVSVTSLGETVDRVLATTDRFGALLGSSLRMRELFADLQRIAATDVTLLIEGETGTGKELVAESVHRASNRANAPYVVFDCGAVAPTLAESELFGHERGAFTGAVSARAGVFEQANGGSLLLDELGELPKDLQPKLLRVLEKREVRRVGSQKTIPVDIRLIAATNRNMAAEVQRGNFREDLYFRLAAAHVVVPPLRDRMEDLTLLVEHFLSLQSPPRSPSDVSNAVWEMFRAYRWPGNVRELHNAVQWALVMPERPLRQFQARATDDVPASSPRPISGRLFSDGEVPPLPVARREAAEAFELEYLKAILERARGNVTRAAAIAKVSRQIVQKLLRKHNLRGTGL